MVTIDCGVQAIDTAVCHLNGKAAFSEPLLEVSGRAPFILDEKDFHRLAPGTSASGRMTNSSFAGHGAVPIRLPECLHHFERDSRQAWGLAALR